MSRTDSVVLAKKRGPGFQGLQLSIAMGASQVLVAIAYAIAARHTSPDELGQILSIIAVSAVLASTTDFGQNSYLTREVAKGEVANDTMYRLLVQKLALTALLGSVLVILFLTLGAVISFEIWGGCLGILILLTTSVSQSAQVPVRAHGKASALALALLADRSAFLLVVVISALRGLDGSVALIAGLLLGLCANVAVTLSVALGDVASRPTRIRALLPGRIRTWKKAWNGTRGYGFATIVASSQQLDTALLGFSSGARAAGEYGAVSRWTMPLTLPASALAQVGVSHVAAHSSVTSAMKHMLRSSWLIALGVVASLAVVPMAPVLTTLLLGEEYAAAGPVLILLAVAAIPSLINQPIAMVLQTRGFESQVSLVLGFCLLLRLASCFLLGAALGSLAAAVGVLVQQMIILLALAAILWKTMYTEEKPVSMESTS